LPGPWPSRMRCSPHCHPGKNPSYVANFGHASHESNPSRRKNRDSRPAPASLPTPGDLAKQAAGRIRFSGAGALSSDIDLAFSSGVLTCVFVFSPSCNAAAPFANIRHPLLDGDSVADLVVRGLRKNPPGDELVFIHIWPVFNDHVRVMRRNSGQSLYVPFCGFVQVNQRLLIS